MAGQWREKQVRGRSSLRFVHFHFLLDERCWKISITRTGATDGVDYQWTNDYKDTLHLMWKAMGILDIHYFFSVQLILYQNSFYYFEVYFSAPEVTF